MQDKCVYLPMPMARLQVTTQLWSLQSLWRPEERFSMMPSTGIQGARVPGSSPKAQRRLFSWPHGFLRSWAVWQERWHSRCQALHPHYTGPRRPVRPLRTPHTAKELTSLWPCCTSTSRPLHNRQWKYLIPFQSPHFFSFLICILILEWRWCEHSSSKQN